MQQNVQAGPPPAVLGAVTWRRSSAADPADDCIEIAALPGGDVAVRSSGDPDATPLVYTRAEIDAFILGVKDGEFDDLIG
jgi:Domain of unknown function (DUF397)